MSHATTSASSSMDNLPCDDIMQFKKLLDQWRRTDDRINAELNAKLPTISFAKNVNANSICKGFYEELRKAYSLRDTAIRECNARKQRQVQELRAERDQKPENQDLVRTLRREQTLLKQLQTEMYEEDIIRQSSLKVYYEKCRDFYKPDDLHEFK